jgi:hypothetical protein
MNGRLTARETRLDSSRLVSAVANYPWMDTSPRIETLYLATLSRPPRADELQRMRSHLEARAGDDPRQSLGDVFWALLNSSEFLLNH